VDIEIRRVWHTLGTRVGLAGVKIPDGILHVCRRHGSAARSRSRSARPSRGFKSRDLEGIVVKHRGSSYGADELRQWIKVKNTAYSQAVDRHELFEG
jgi:hypothetical protein